MRRTTTLNEALRQFGMASKILREDYGMSRDMDYEDEYGCDGEDTAEYDDYKDEPDNDGNTDAKDDRISQIREIALGGLQDYAHDVDGEEYQFYKKIWLMCDKAVSDKDGAAVNGGI